MSTATPSRPPAAYPASRPAPASSGGAGGAAIDPVRLLKQHKLSLLAAAIVGLLGGLGAYYVLLRLAPQYRASVTYQALPRGDDKPFAQESTGIEIQEMDRYTQTQARVMSGDRVIRAALNDPKVRNDTSWGVPFRTETGQINIADAAREFKDMVSARVVAGTSLIEMSITAGTSIDAATLANVVHDAYWRDLQLQNSAASRERRDALNKSNNELTQELSRLDARRRKLLQDGAINSVDNNGSIEAQLLAQIGPEIIDTQKTMDRLQTDLNRKQEQLKAEGGIQFGDDLLEEIERDQAVVQATASISEITTIITARQQTGLGDSHREIVQLRKQLEARQSSLLEVRESALRKAFVGQMERVRQAIEGSKTQLAELTRQRETLTRRREDIVRILAEYEQLGREYLEKSAQLASLKQLLDGIAASEGMVSSERIGRMRLLERARQPEQVAFPKLPLMLGAGFVLAMGLTGSVLVLREVLDQRIKGPSDVLNIPRMRLLGLIPAVIDDPGKPAAAETAFRDCPSGAIAEGFRQLRPSVVKRIQPGGHKAILVMGAMPGSGSSTVCANLAMAFAAAETNVLLIDANFRRPSLHKNFKLAEGPGLGDVLSRTKTMDEAVQQTAVPHLSLLSAGNSAARAVPERLATEAMTQLIRDASAKYDLVLVDTAPAMVAGDGQALANRCDGVILVVRALAEKRGLVARIRDQLGDTRAEFLGVVINAVRASAGGYLKGNIRTSYEYQNSGPTT